MGKVEWFAKIQKVASFALVGAAIMGAMMQFLPDPAPFDLRYVGVVVGGGLAAMKIFHLV